jgi:hypothetical protein
MRNQHVGGFKQVHHKREDILFLNNRQ